MARLGHRGGIRVLLLGAAIVAFVIPPASVEAAGTCATPGRDGTATLNSVLNTYTSALPTPLQGQRNFQVIRVPQYVTATLAGGLAAGAFNGSTGGVLVFDVDGALNLNGAAVSVSQEGFRAGLGRQLAGGAGGTGTDCLHLSANNFH